MKKHITPVTRLYFEICKSSSAFLLSLVNDTLDYAQLEYGKFKMNFEQVPTKKLVAQIYQLINVQLRQKQEVFLVQTIAQGTPTTIETDYQRLK